MPTGPRGEKRPAGVIANAVHIARIATGEIEETYEDPAAEKTRRVSVTLKTTKAKKSSGGRAASPTSMVAEGQ